MAKVSFTKGIKRSVCNWKCDKVPLHYMQHKNYVQKKFDSLIENMHNLSRNMKCSLAQIQEYDHVFWPKNLICRFDV